MSNVPGASQPPQICASANHPLPKNWRRGVTRQTCVLTVTKKVCFLPGKDAGAVDSRSMHNTSPPVFRRGRWKTQRSSVFQLGWSIREVQDMRAARKKLTQAPPPFHSACAVPAPSSCHPHSHGTSAQTSH